MQISNLIKVQNEKKRIKIQRILHDSYRNGNIDGVSRQETTEWGWYISR